jgi:lipopolysaccharide export system protein LptC
VIWRIFIICALLIVAVMSVIDRERRPARGEISAPAPPLQPGYFINGARITEMDAEGLPLYRVEAERIQQNPVDDSIRLEQLILTYRTPEARDWTLTAARGFVPPGSKTLNLAGNVRIIGQPAADMQPAVVYTERLTVNTETSIASTSDRVDIEWGSRRISTMGLVADLKAERLRLESGVHGRFVPNHR